MSRPLDSSVRGDEPGPPGVDPQRPVRVLIVDDHPIVRDGLERLLGAESDVNVVGSVGGTAGALDLLASGPVDVAVVDLSLAGGSGMDLLEAIRAHYPETRSLVFSIHDPEIYAPRALRAGASAYVSKSQPSEDVLAAVRALASGEPALSHDTAGRILRRMRRGTPPAAGDVDQLSDRELQVFEMIGRGLSTSDVAHALHLSPKTVETHRKRIKTKLGLETGTKLLIRAAQWVAANA